MPSADTSKTVITRQVFDHLVALAQFELAEEEAEYLRAELNGQLAAIRQLEAIEVGEDTAITSHGVPYAQGLRQDLRQDELVASDKAEQILAGAPEREDRYIVAPDIPHQEME